MRYFISILLLVSCFSSSLYAKKTENPAAIVKFTEKSQNLNKKQRNSLKTEFFTNQIDFLNLGSQNHSLVADHFLKLNQGIADFSKEEHFDFALINNFCYSFIFQHLYPKHSFW